MKLVSTWSIILFIIALFHDIRNAWVYTSIRLYPEYLLVISVSKLADIANTRTNTKIVLKILLIAITYNIFNVTVDSRELLILLEYVITCFLFRDTLVTSTWVRNELFLVWFNINLKVSKINIILTNQYLLLDKLDTDEVMLSISLLCSCISSLEIRSLILLSISERWREF